jgi:DNA-binding protein H-NS
MRRAGYKIRRRPSCCDNVPSGNTGAFKMPKRKMRRNSASSRRLTTVKRTRGSGLTSMTLDALMVLRDNVDRVISTRAEAERTTIERQLARLSGFVGGSAPRRKKSSLKGRKVAPKYRNPANPSETWAGRGVRPRWLQAQLKKGRKIEAFAIERTKTGSKKRAAKKIRRRMIAKSARKRMVHAKRAQAQTTASSPSSD